MSRIIALIHDVRRTLGMLLFVLDFILGNLIAIVMGKADHGQLSRIYGVDWKYSRVGVA